MSQLVLSIYHGIDLLGRGFEKAGFCVVRAAELDLGFDAGSFTPTADRFDGIIAGTPCNEFSLANRTSRTYNGHGKKQLDNFARIVLAARSPWALLENVPQVPNVEIAGYSRQRFDLNANECGLDQSRLRHFQYFYRTGHTLTINRSRSQGPSQSCVTASEGKRPDERRSLATIAKLQGLPETFELPYFTLGAKYKVIGQGVPVEMARRIAEAIYRSVTAHEVSPSHKTCTCGCGRDLIGNQTAATPACRKRNQRNREPGRVTWL